MKVLVIDYLDETEVIISKGSEVTVSDGVNEMSGGVVSVVIDSLDKVASYPSHVHTIDFPAGETSPPIGG